MTRARVLRVAILAVLVVRVGLFAGAARADATDPKYADAKKTFTTRCMACHTFGKGVKVGPDLKGVNERRQRAWIVKFVRSSSTVIASGDPIASELFGQFKQQRMPDWTDLSEEQVNAIMDWLGIDGPDQQDPDAKLAELASAGDIDTGSQLFHGGRALTNGGAACATCHAVRDEAGTAGGSLAPELTSIFATYQDLRMTLFLKHPCFLRYPEANATAFLTPEESYALKAYLRHTALGAQPASVGVTRAIKPVEGDDNGHENDAAKAAGVTTSPSAGGPGAGKPPSRRVEWAMPARTTAPGIGRTTHLEGDLLFLAFPYAALAVLLIGLAIRFGLARRDPEAMRSTAKSAWQVLAGGKLWRTGLAVTFVLHLLGLLVPHAILGWNASPLRLYLLEGAGLILGVIALVGWVQVMWHHLGRAVGPARGGLIEIADCIFLSVMCTAIVSGLIGALSYRWGSSWGAETLAPYISSLAHGAPATALVEEMPFLVRLHVFSWFVVVALVPFTSVASLIVPAIDRVMMLIARPVNAGAAAGKRLAQRLSPARWLWPEEDAVEAGGDADHAQES